MGWSELDDRMLDGDGPADAVADALVTIACEAQQRTGALPTGEAVLSALVQALNLDGWRAPFHSEPRRVDAVLVPRRERRVRIEGRDAPPWLVAELYATLDVVAEEYVSTWNRPPHLRELIHYLGHHFERADDETGACIANPGGWVLRDARFVFRKDRKPGDRAPPPDVAPPLPAQRRRVRHAKFGDGVVVADQGDRLTVQFGDARRVVLGSFITPIS